jgi:hypothetical protein
LNHSHHQPASNTLPFFEPFADSPVALNHHHIHSSSELSQSIYSSPPPRRTDHGRLPAMDWRLNQQLHQHQHQHQQQATLPSDWRLASEKSVAAFNFKVGKEEPLRSSFVYQQSQTTPSFQTSHEVSYLLDYSRRRILIYVHIF